MKTQIPDSVQIKIDHARFLENAILKLQAFETLHNATSIDFRSVHIPPPIKKEFRDWIEQRIIIHKSYLLNEQK